MEQLDLILLSVVGSVTSIILLSLKLMFKSKCIETNCCCGLIKIKRDVKLETELENDKAKKPQPDTIGNISDVNMQQIQHSGDSSV
jgi:hypothetical protein